MALCSRWRRRCLEFLRTGEGNKKNYGREFMGGRAAWVVEWASGCVCRSFCAAPCALRRWCAAKKTGRRRWESECRAINISVYIELRRPLIRFKRSSVYLVYMDTPRSVTSLSKLLFPPTKLSPTSHTRAMSHLSESNLLNQNFLELARINLKFLKRGF